MELVTQLVKHALEESTTGIPLLDILIADSINRSRMATQKELKELAEKEAA